MDLTAAYRPQNSSRVERGFAFTESYQHLLIVDEFEFTAGATVRNVTWTMHTKAAIQLSTASTRDGSRVASSAVLSLGGAHLYATVIEPASATFSAATVDLLPPQKPSAGVSKLQVHLNLNLAAPSTRLADGGRVTRIVVGLSLSEATAAVTPSPLAQWKANGPFAGGD
eukprot:COSAG02_NODE_711_length_18126_cov_43.786986_12_plen_169_part_00